MPAFEYLALDSSGRQQKGTLEADSPRQVRQQLRDKGMSPLQVDRVRDQQQRKGAGGLLRRGMSDKDLALVTRQLATLIQAALPIEEALKAVAAQQERGKVHNILIAVRSKVLEGHTLAQGMGNFPSAFPSMYRATVAAGEHSGHLDKILTRLADYWEKRQKSVQQVQLAMLYPAMLTLAAIGIVTFLLSYVVPEFVKVFADTGQPLPGLTIALIGVSHFVQHYGVYLLILIVLMVIGARRLLKNPDIRMRWHRFILRVPIIGKFSRSYNTARFAATLSILARSGVGLVDALVIAARVLSNDALKKSVEGAAKEVSEGSSLHRALERTGAFSPLMLHMISSGEQTGELDNMLERTADSQDLELQHRMAVLVGLFEPLILVVMGGVVLTIVLAILMPIIDINQMVG